MVFSQATTVRRAFVRAESLKGVNFLNFVFCPLNTTHNTERNIRVCLPTVSDTLKYHNNNVYTRSPRQQTSSIRLARTETNNKQMLYIYIYTYKHCTRIREVQREFKFLYARVCVCVCVQCMVRVCAHTRYGYAFKMALHTRRCRVYIYIYV